MEQRPNEHENPHRRRFAHHARHAAAGADRGRLSTSCRRSTASTGSTCSSAKSPDLVITDINMPKMDGFGFIEGARKTDRFRVVPILVLTTESDPEKKQRAAQRRRDRLDRQAVRSGQARRRHSSRGRLTVSGDRQMDRDAGDSRNVLPGMRGATRRTRDRAPRHGGRRRRTRRPSTPCSARCIRSRAAPAPSSSTGSSASRTRSRRRSTRSATALLGARAAGDESRCCARPTCSPISCATRASGGDFDECALERD